MTGTIVLFYMLIVHRREASPLIDIVNGLGDEAEIIPRPGALTPQSRHSGQGLSQSERIAGEAREPELSFLPNGKLDAKLGSVSRAV